MLFLLLQVGSFGQCQGFIISLVFKWWSTFSLLLQSNFPLCVRVYNAAEKIASKLGDLHVILQAKAVKSSF